MTGSAVFLVACAALVWLSGLERTTQGGSRWREGHLPFMVAILAGLAAAGSDPLSRALLSGAPAPVAPGREYLWFIAGLPVTAVALSVGIGLLGNHRAAKSSVWAATCAGAVVCSLAMAGRLRLMDGQLMILGGIALLWWRTSAHTGDAGARGRMEWRAPVGYGVALAGGVGGAMAGSVGWAPAACALGLLVSAVWAMGRGARSAPAAALGSGAWTVLATISLGLGIATVAHIGVLAVTEARRASMFSGEPALFVIADVARSSPYMGGLESQAPEGLLMLLLAGVLALSVGGGPRWRRPVGLVCLGAGTAVAAWRLWALWTMGG